MMKRCSVGVTILILCCFLFAGCGAKSTEAESFPEKQLTIICPFGAGGASDVVLRTLVPYLEEEMGQSVIISYKEGAGGIAGVNEYVGMTADGYTLVTYNDPHIFLQPEFQTTAYTKEDLVPLMGITEKPEALFVRADSPFETLEDFLTYAKENPKSLTIGNTGTYSSNHLTFALLQAETDTAYTRVAFTNGNKSFTALLAGETDACVASIDWLATHEGNIRALAVAAEDTVAEFPEVKTFKECNYEIVNAVNNNLYVTSAAPEEIIAVLQEKFAKVCENEQLAKDLTEAGIPAVLYNSDELIAYEEKVAERLETVKSLISAEEQ